MRWQRSDRKRQLHRERETVTQINRDSEDQNRTETGVSTDIYQQLAV